MSKSYNSLKEIEWTPKNIAMISAASIFMLAGIWYGNHRAVVQLEEKKQKLQKMTLTEVGEYIVEHNKGTVHIDAITEVINIRLEGKRLEFPYYVKDNFLKKMATRLHGGTEGMKSLLQKDTLKEDCSKTALRIFLEKGGTMHYTYRLIKNGKEQYLFDFNNTIGLCPKNTF